MLISYSFYRSVVQLAIMYAKLHSYTKELGSIAKQVVSLDS